MNTQTTPIREQLLQLLKNWIDQRPGLDPRDYISDWNDTAGRSAYRADGRSIARDYHDAMFLLVAVQHSQITVEGLLSAFPSAFSGRLSVVAAHGGTWELRYTTGQYWPTEYRKAACAVLAYALWDYHRAAVTSEDGGQLRAKFVRLFGRAIAKRWF